MKKRVFCGIAAASLCMSTHVGRAEPALTIYNQNFAVVRDTVPLNLTAGQNRVQLSNLTAHLEPDSVVLRDPSGKRELQILEQNYRSDPISQDLLLSLNEGKTIDFLVQRGLKDEIVKGRIVRSNYVPRNASNFFQSQMAYAYGGSGNYSQPIIEVDGQMRFGLPGIPLFPSLPNDSLVQRQHSQADSELDFAKRQSRAAGRRDRVCDAWHGVESRLQRRRA